MKITPKKISPCAHNNAVNNLLECKKKVKKLNSYPLKLYIEPTTACNLNCSYCTLQKWRVKHELDMGIFYALKDQLFDHCSEVNLFLGGEPTLAKGFAEMLDVCAQYPFITKFFSNLSYRNNPILEKMVETGCWLNVSFDGVEDSEQTREGIKIDYVINNIKYLIACQEQIKNPKFHLRLAVVVSKLNVTKLESILNWAKMMNIKEVMYGCIDSGHMGRKDALTAQDAVYFNKVVRLADDIKIRISTPTHIGGVKLVKASNWRDFKLPVDDYFPHYAEDCNPDVDKHFCPYPWLQTVVQATGEIVSCCQRKLHLANFTPQTDFIKEIWNNKKYIKLRSMKDHRKCKDKFLNPCGLMTFSIWGGESRLNCIPDKISETACDCCSEMGADKSVLEKV